MTPGALHAKLLLTNLTMALTVRMWTYNILVLKVKNFDY